MTNHTGLLAKICQQLRNELSAVVLDDKIYVIGGEDFAAGGGQKDTVEVYDIAKDNWAEDIVAPMPLPLDHSASAAYD